MRKRKVARVMKLLAPAKVNIALSVEGKRDDSYHELCTLMHTVDDLCDVVYMESADTLSVGFDISGMPSENTVTRAAKAYMRESGSYAADIRVLKRIPAEAGLGGGSADAAAVLRGMQRMYGLLSEEKLYQIALEVGADVPFCLHGQTAVCRGRGELMTPVVHKALPLVMVKDSYGISTARLFSRLNLPCAPVDTDAARRAYECGDMIALARHMNNSLESAAFAERPELALLKEELLSTGALGAVMTGSGSAMIGLYADFEASRLAGKMLEGHDFVHICSSEV